MTTTVNRRPPPTDDLERAEHPVALRLLRTVLGGPMLLGYRTPGLGLVDGASRA